MIIEKFIQKFMTKDEKIGLAKSKAKERLLIVSLSSDTFTKPNPVFNDI